MKKIQKTSKPFRKLAWYGLGAAGLCVLAYFVMLSMIPVNTTYPVFGVPTNHYIKALYTKNGAIFVTTSTKGAKKSFESVSKPIVSGKLGELITIHFINEDLEKHSLNLDEFNVHSGEIGYFGTYTVTFLADKAGKFTFYCSSHPEMSGTIIIE
ncbi:MAG: cupredoxin domain-containing protein [Candidatus Nitrosotenuis sp.]